MLRIVEGNQHVVDKVQFLDSLKALEANYKKFYHNAICHCVQVQLSKMQHKELSLNGIAFMLNQILELCLKNDTIKKQIIEVSGQVCLEVSSDGLAMVIKRFVFSVQWDLSAVSNPERAFLQVDLGSDLTHAQHSVQLFRVVQESQANRLLRHPYRHFVRRECARMDSHRSSRLHW